MKIAMVTETFLPNTDGIVTRLCETIKWLQKQGHQVLIIAPDLGVTEYEGAKVEGIPARSFFLYKEKKLSMPNKKVGKLLEEFNPDIVHVINPAVLGVAGIHYGRKYPLVASYHTRIPQYADYYRVPFLKPALWWYFRTLHNRADLNLCTSQTINDELNEKRFKHVKLWTRGVAVEKFGPKHFSLEMRDKLSHNMPNKKLLLYVGRLAAEKEIEKIKSVLTSSDQFCLAIVGDGPSRNALEKHFEGTNTVFTGFLHGEELAQAYASSDCFIFPSTTETLGLVILEAMASGLPVIAARSGPTCEQIEDGVTGLLYDADDDSSFAQTVLKLKDEMLTKRMSKEAYTVGQNFGWAKPSQQLLGFYESVLADDGVKISKDNVR